MCSINPIPGPRVSSQQLSTESLEQMTPAAESSRSSEDNMVLGSHRDNHYVTITSDIVKHVDLNALRRKRNKSQSTFSRIFGKPRVRRSIAVSDPSIMEGNHSNAFAWRIHVANKLRNIMLRDLVACIAHELGSVPRKHESSSC